MRSDRMQLVCGWTAVACSTGLACFWALWGIIENFHEGWYGDSALSNIGLMFVQYLSPMLAFLAIALISIRWQHIGGVLHATAVRPDKESPLWDTRSKVIYWWTATEIDQERAYMIVYDGKVWPRQKRISPDDFSFRAVRNVNPEDG